MMTLTRICASMVLASLVVYSTATRGAPQYAALAPFTFSIEQFDLFQSDERFDAIVRVFPNALLLGFDGGNTFLHYAVALNKPDLVRRLLNLGADPTLANSSGLTPLHTAASLSDTGVLAVFKDAYPNFTAVLTLPITGEPRTGSNSIVHVALFNAQPAILAFLLANRADPYMLNAMGMTPLMLAHIGHHPDLVRSFITTLLRHTLGTGEFNDQAVFSTALSALRNLHDWTQARYLSSDKTNLPPHVAHLATVAPHARALLMDHPVGVLPCLHQALLLDRPNLETLRALLTLGARFDLIPPGSTKTAFRLAMEHRVPEVHTLFAFALVLRLMVGHEYNARSYDHVDALIHALADQIPPPLPRSRAFLQTPQAEDQQKPQTLKGLHAAYGPFSS